MGWHWRLAFMEPGPSHFSQKRMIRRGIGSQRLGDHTAVIEKNATKLMLELRNFKGDPHSPVLKCVDLSQHHHPFILTCLQRNEPGRARGDIWD
jgi:hypothetical protein